MFEITIKGDTLEELAGNMQRIAAMYQATPAGDDAAPKPRGSRKTASAPKTADVSEDAAAYPTASDEDAKLEAELNEPAEPMPETAKQVVDAGTGQPVGATSTDSDEPITMTMDDVKNAAAKLAAKDSPTLAKILKDYGAAKLSEVPKEKLGDFAADVMEALG
jgi:hypothetical protein